MAHSLRSGPCMLAAESSQDVVAHISSSWHNFKMRIRLGERTDHDATALPLRDGICSSSQTTLVPCRLDGRSASEDGHCFEPGFTRCKWSRDACAFFFFFFFFWPRCEMIRLHSAGQHSPHKAMIHKEKLMGYLDKQINMQSTKNREKRQD